MSRIKTMQMLECTTSRSVELVKSIDTYLGIASKRSGLCGGLLMRLSQSTHILQFLGGYNLTVVWMHKVPPSQDVICSQVLWNAQDYPGSALNHSGVFWSTHYNTL